jgi:hypothetical protein
MTSKEPVSYGSWVTQACWDSIARPEPVSASRGFAPLDRSGVCVDAQRDAEAAADVEHAVTITDVLETEINLELAQAVVGRRDPVVEVQREVLVARPQERIVVSHGHVK